MMNLRLIRREQQVVAGPYRIAVTVFREASSKFAILSKIYIT